MDIQNIVIGGLGASPIEDKSTPTLEVPLLPSTFYFYLKLSTK